MTLGVVIDRMPEGIVRSAMEGTQVLGAEHHTAFA